MKQLFAISSLIIFLSISLNMHGEVFNQSCAIDSIHNYFDNDDDTIYYSGSIELKLGDIILIYQAKGIIFDNLGHPISSNGYTGRFEFNVVKKANNTLKQVIVQRVMRQNGLSFNGDNAIQLVKVGDYSIINSNDTVKSLRTAKPWDGKTGGIVAIIADTLVLEADIDVSGCGFRGGNPGADSGATCWGSNDSLELVKHNFSLQKHRFAGYKGESVVQYDTNMCRGNMNYYNGGGGGNGYHSGGGGGSSYYEGGKGGSEGTLCSPTITDLGGDGGRGLSTGLLSTMDTYAPLAFFGGGGGSGTQDNGFHASRGGNGGGIIIIMANAIKANNHAIISNGESVTDTCNAGAGGGGAGGSIILGINNYIDNLEVSIMGGNGGSVTSTPPIAGTGGGGAGGFLRYSGTSLSNKVILKKDFGKRGYSHGVNKFASNGYEGAAVGDLIMPTKGFLFNIMPDDQELCEGSEPIELKASWPSGGAKDDFKYFWLEKSHNKNKWDTVGYDRTYTPMKDRLTDTTYYQRVIHLYNNSKIITTDSSYILTYYYLNKIENNIFTIDTNIVCQNVQMPLICKNISPNTITGGRGKNSYTYLWEYNVKGWLPAPGDSNNFNYLPPHDTAKFKHTVKFRRIIQSGSCRSISNLDSIKVLPNIENNVIRDSQWISLGNTIKPIEGDSVTGGTGSYIFSFQSKTDDLDWKDVDTSFDYRVKYNIPQPTKVDTFFIWRKTMSDDIFHTCVSYSNIVAIHILDSISNNTIKGDTTICGKTAPDTIRGTTPIGGDKIYDFMWLIGIDTSKNKYVKIKWDTLAYQYHDKTTLKTKTSFYAGIINDTAYIRRVALSGRNNCCINYSNIIKISAIPAIEDNNLYHSSDTTVCYNQDAGTIFAKNPKYGEGSIYTYLWEQQQDGNFKPADGINNEQHYKTPNLVDTISIRRKVVAGKCKSFSDTFKIIVLQSIDNNIAGHDTTLCKDQQPAAFSSSSPTGGTLVNYLYKWLYSNDNTNWTDSPGNNTLINYQPGSMETTTYYKRVVYSGENNCCKDTSSKITINVNELPSATFKDFDDSLCLGLSHETEISITGYNKIKVDYTDGYNNGVISGNQGTLKLVAKPIIAKNYSYKLTKVTDDNNCEAKIKTGEGKLSVFEVPVALAGEDTSVCGDSVALHANKGVGEGHWSSTVEATYIPDINSPSAQVISKEYGHQDFTWHLDNGGCIDSSKITISFYQPPPNPLIGEDQKGPFLFETNLEAVLPVLGKASWSSPDNTIVFENVEDPNSHVENLKFGKNYFQWNVQHGVCEAASDTLIIEAVDLKLTEGFSPNGDNINDLFVIKGLEHVKNVELIVLNKWGKEIYHSKEYKNDWDGKFNGNELPLDTYYYIINVIGRTYKGFLVIRK